MLSDSLPYALTLALIVLPPFLIGFVAFKSEQERQ